MMDAVKHWSSQKSFVYSVMLLCFILLSIIPLSRVGHQSPVLFDSEPYLILRLAETMDGSISDKLSFWWHGYDSLYDRYVPTPLISLVISILGLSNFTSSIFSMIIGVAHAGLLVLLFKRYNFGRTYLVWLLAVVFTSPHFYSLHTTPSESSLAIVFGLLALLLLDCKKDAFAGLAVLLATIADPLGGCLILFVILCVRFLRRITSQDIIVPILGFLVGIFCMVIGRGFHLTLFHEFQVNFNLNSLLFLLGGIYGWTSFLLIYAGIGVVAFRIRRKSILVPLLIFVLGLGVFLPGVIPYASTILTTVAAYGLNRLYKMNWSSDSFRMWVMLLIACGLFFGWFAYYNYALDAHPTVEHKVMAETIAQLTDVDSTVYATAGNNEWISYWSGRSTVSDSYSVVIDDREKIIAQDAIALAKTRHSIAPYVTLYDIQSIVLENKKGTVGGLEEQNLRFFTDHSEMFIRTLTVNKGQMYVRSDKIKD